MKNDRKEPSRAWRDSIFNSGHRRCVATESKSTTRVPVLTDTAWQFGEGGHEATALLLLRHLKAFGYVKRFKSQPFALEELGGPVNRIPDLLVELEPDRSPSVHVIQVKSKRFITSDVEERFSTERELLEGNGMCFHVWTDRDHLSKQTSQTVRILDRGFRHCVTPEVGERIGLAAKIAKTLAPLLDQFGWDDAMSAAALGYFHINCMEKTHENSPVYLHFPSFKYSHLFARGNVSDDWWESLAPGQADQPPRCIPRFPP